MRLFTNILNKVLAVVLTIAALVVGQSAWSTDKTVTYRITAMSDYQTYGTQLTFTPDNSGFGTGTGSKVATISNTTNTNGFTVELDDGVRLQLSLNNNSSMTFTHNSNNTQYAIYLNLYGNQNPWFTVSCSDYYITHVRLATLDNETINGTGTPEPKTSGTLDLDVDIDKSTYNNSCYRANVTENTNFGKLIITLSDSPRNYSITYVDAVTQPGLVNNNPTSYNVATPDFQITADKFIRTNYALEGLYSDAEHTQKVNLPVTITRGSAATIKDITYYAVWTDNWPGGGEGTEDSPYMITTPAHLILIADQVRLGVTYTGKCFKLGNSIDMQGTSFNGIACHASGSFSGVFDGDGYTIDHVTISSVFNDVGVFGKVSGGTIKNLVINNASISTNSSSHDVGVLVGGLRESGTISNCVVNNSSVNGQSHIGGIVGYFKDSSVSGCLILNSSVCGSEYVSASYGGKQEASSVNSGNRNHNVTVNGSVWQDGQTVYLLTPGANVTLPVRTGGTVIGNSGIKTYNSGATVGTTEYYLSGRTVSLSPSGEVPEGYKMVFSTTDGTISGNTLTMPASDVTVNVTTTDDLWDITGGATGEEDHPYTISAPDGFNLLASNVNGGRSYSGKFFKLGANITVTSMVGTSTNKFSGTFDGDGNNYTLTLDYNATSDFAAPFAFVDGATFRNLHVAGTINTTQKMAGGIVGDCYGTSLIQNCHSGVTINSSYDADGTHGGLVGRVQGGELTITGCLFDGELLTDNGTNGCGGFVGWKKKLPEVKTYISNSLFAPATISIGTSGSATFCRNSATITNSYYTTDFNDGNQFTGQGKQAIALADVSGLDFGTATQYGVSGITAYTNGIRYAGTFYYGEGESVTINYDRTIPAGTDAYTVCLPYDPPTGDDVTYYTLSSVSGSTLTFTEVASPVANTPYLVVATAATSVGTAATAVDFSTAVVNPDAVDGYAFKGTLRGLDHAASVDKYILQSNNRWGIVNSEKTGVYIPPFRAYIEATGDGARTLYTEFGDGTTGLDSIRTIDADCTEQW